MHANMFHNAMLCRYLADLFTKEAQIANGAKILKDGGLLLLQMCLLTACMGISVKFFNDMHAHGAAAVEERTKLEPE